MCFKNLNLFLIVILLNFNLSLATEVKIVTKVDNFIISNIDIENQNKYLLVINKNLQNLNKNELIILSKNSLIKEIIKEKEINKFFKIDKNSQLGDKLIKENYLSQGFKNISEYLIYLDKMNVNLEYLRKRLILEKLWNTLIYEKYKNKVKIDENKLRKKVVEFISLKEKKYELNISEILFDFNTDFNQLMEFINIYGFESAAAKYSISDTSKKGGKIGWINPNNLAKNLKEKIIILNVGEISAPIKIPNGNLIIKINLKRQIKNKLNLDEEVKKLESYETNKQLNSFSVNYYKKLKQNTVIYEY